MVVAVTLAQSAIKVGPSTEEVASVSHHRLSHSHHTALPSTTKLLQKKHGEGKGMLKALSTSAANN